ncbi:NAD(P)H-quinone oxidoreductase [Promicromonospora sp. NPDC059942]|uniref:NAD(P)H-quinone oxidoreductase n=1 Tax=Promicromonospora sp. NPDC059942 TaxID=3347009 RepID=UPI00364DF419
MRAVTISGPGPSGKLSISSLNHPNAGQSDVVITVAAAGVNRADLLQRAGYYPPPANAPDWPGLEISGTVKRVGHGVSRWRAGDRVVALLEGGGYAEEVAVRETQVLPVPDGIDLVDAAALPEAGCTVWNNLVDVGRLRRGEWVLVHGGSGGIGSIAIQVAKALGAHVATTAGGPERAARCAELGADVVVDHRQEDFVEAVRSATGGRGADVVLDLLGGGALGDNVRVLARGGRLVVIGMQQGRRGELDLSALLSRLGTISGTMLRSRPPEEKARIVADTEQHLWPLFASGQVRPVIHARIPFAEAQSAHDLLESGEAFGKVLLVP